MESDEANNYSERFTEVSQQRTGEPPAVECTVLDVMAIPIKENPVNTKPRLREDKLLRGFHMSRISILFFSIERKLLFSNSDRSGVVIPTEEQ